MTHDQREIRRKKRVLEYAERIGNINKACRYFGVARSSFYEWRDRYRELGDDPLGLVGRLVQIRPASISSRRSQSGR